MMNGFGYGYNMMNSGWWQLGMILFWLLVLAGIVVLVVWAVRQFTGPGHGSSQMPPGQPPRDQACETARLRYAKGEITKEEYDEICRTLGV
jgi:putative membrane protein